MCAVCCVIHTCHDVTPRRPPEAEAALLSPPLPVCDATISTSVAYTFPTFPTLSIVKVLHCMVITALLCITSFDSIGTASSVEIQAPTFVPQKAGLQLTAGSKILRSEVWQDLIWHAGVAANATSDLQVSLRLCRWLYNIFVLYYMILY